MDALGTLLDWFGSFSFKRGTVVLVSYEPKRGYQMDLLVKPTPITCLFLIGRVIITPHFFFFF